MSKKAWKRFRPDSNQYLEDALTDERKLTARWYLSMSGNLALCYWEKQDLWKRIGEASRHVNKLNGIIAAQEFAAMPDA